MKHEEVKRHGDCLSGLLSLRERIKVRANGKAMPPVGPTLLSGVGEVRHLEPEPGETNRLAFALTLASPGGRGAKPEKNRPFFMFHAFTSSCLSLCSLPPRWLISSSKNFSHFSLAISPMRH
jgi:hypothetical protein